MKVSIKKMNCEISKWLYGDAVGSKVFIYKNGNQVGISKDIKYPNMPFHEDYDLLMKAFKKALSKDFWHAVYPVSVGYWKGTGKNKKWANKNMFYCAFTNKGIGRMGYGEKLTNDFYKPTPILAMHYSLYRLITKGLEY